MAVKKATAVKGGAKLFAQGSTFAKYFNGLG